MIGVEVWHGDQLDTDAVGLARRILGELQVAAETPVAPIPALSSEHWAVRAKALRALGRMKSVSSGVGRTIGSFRKDPNADVRLASYRALDRRGLLRKVHLDEALADTSWEVRWFGWTRKNAEKDVEPAAWYPAFLDGAVEVRVRAGRRANVDYASWRWPMRRRLMRDEAGVVRAAGFRSLHSFPMPWRVENGELSPADFDLAELRRGQGPPLEIVACVKAGLADDDAEVRAWAARHIVDLGALFPGRTAAFEHALEDPIRTVREWALESLVESEMSVPELLSPIMRQLQHPDDFVRWQAVRALALMGEAAAPAVPGIIIQTGADWEMLREHAVLALGEIGVASDEVEAALRARLDDEWSDVGIAAEEALKKLGLEGGG